MYVQTKRCPVSDGFWVSLDEININQRNSQVSNINSSQNQGQTAIILIFGLTIQMPNYRYPKITLEGNRPPAGGGGGCARGATHPLKLPKGPLLATQWAKKGIFV